MAATSILRFLSNNIAKSVEIGQADPSDSEDLNTAVLWYLSIKQHIISKLLYKNYFNLYSDFIFLKYFQNKNIWIENFKQKYPNIQN